MNQGTLKRLLDYYNEEMANASDDSSSMSASEASDDNELIQEEAVKRSSAMLNSIIPQLEISQEQKEQVLAKLREQFNRHFVTKHRGQQHTDKMLNPRKSKLDRFTYNTLKEIKKQMS